MGTAVTFLDDYRLTIVSCTPRFREISGFGCEGEPFAQWVQDDGSFMAWVGYCAESVRAKSFVGKVLFKPPDLSTFEYVAKDCVLDTIRISQNSDVPCCEFRVVLNGVALR